MVDYIKDNFAVWAKYQNRPIGEGWERFAERTVGIDDDGNVVYKNNEAAQVEDDGGSPRELYQYDNTFGGIAFGDTGVPTRINVDDWGNLESYDGTDSRTILSYAGTAGNDEVAYYDTTAGEWKVGSVASIYPHNHDDRYVNVTGAESMEGPLDITVGGLSVAAGLTVLASGASITGGAEIVTGNFIVTAGKIETTIGNINALLGDINAVAGDFVFGYGGKLRSRNAAESDYVDIAQVNSYNRIIIGETSYNTVITAGTTDEFPWMYHHSVNDLIAPFTGLTTWTDGWVPVWNVANNDFYKADPATFGTEWDKRLDEDEFIEFDNGAGYQNAIGYSSTDAELKVGDNAEKILIRGSTVTIKGGDLILDPTNEIDAYDWLDFKVNNIGIHLWYNSLSYIGMYMTTGGILTIGDSSVVGINLRGNPTRPQYNGADLALLSDAGGGAGTDTDAIHLSEANEFNEVALATGASSDRLFIEDASAAYVKKYCLVSSLPFAATSHTHDDRYYTETEVDTLLTSYLPLSAGSGKQLTGDLYFAQYRNIILYNNASISGYNVAHSASYVMLKMDTVDRIKLGGSSTLETLIVGSKISLQPTNDIEVSYGPKLRMKNSSGTLRDVAYMSGSDRIFGGTGSATWVQGSTLKLYRYGYSGSASPSGTNWPTVGSWGIHIDDGSVYLVYQNGTTPVGVQLTALW